MSRLSFTTHGSNLKSPDLPGSLNCNCDLVAHSSLPMDPSTHELCYIVVKVIHQITRNIHGFIHDTTTTLNAYFVKSFDVIWESICRYIFSMADYDIRSEYDCIKIHSYDVLPSSNHYYQRASPHNLCLQHFDTLMHDLGIHNIFTKKLFFRLIQVKKRTCFKDILIISDMSILERGFSP